MAESLQLLKRRIKTAKNIAQIGKAMEMISASKIKRAQKAVENNKPYAIRITDLTKTATEAVDLGSFNHPYLKTGQSNKKIVIMISPDRGLCGSLNTNLFKKVIEYEDKDLLVITVGKKVERFANRIKLNIIASFPMGNTVPSLSLVYQLTQIVNPYILNGEVSDVSILFAEFKSIFQQTPQSYRLLPINRSEIDSEKKDLPYKAEPSWEKILSELLPHYFEVRLYNALINAYTSEQAARMVAMQSAKNNALDVADFLTLSYNKFRQERITNELLDLSNGRFV
ncbi:ATP synthase F1 subunit gamma [Candidatus Parcubacteria bacterium]|nr:MAG: ATP synthase F1 subunit gamma [Candidatus Parcubacteria bacterium]